MQQLPLSESGNLAENHVLGVLVFHICQRIRWEHETMVFILTKKSRELVLKEYQKV